MTPEQSPQTTPPPTRVTRFSPRTRRTAVAGILGLAAAGFLTASPASGDPADQLRQAIQAAPAPADLQTPFERTNGAQWTTVEQSQRFWRTLDARSDRVIVNTIGRSTEGRPLQLVRLGAPPKSQQDAAKGSTIFYVCSVHGNENSGRESCMQLARDMATTTDPAWNRLLKSTTILFLNVNPDGWAADTRQNAQGLDVNRDYMALESPEARAVVKTIRDWKPDVLNDLHEYGPNEYYKTDLLQLWPRNLQADDGIHDLAKTMSEDYAGAQVVSAGYTSGEYGLYVKDGEPFLQVAGDGQGRILRNYAGLQNVVGMLSETAGDPLNDEEAADESLLNRRRVEVNYLSAVGSAQMMLENSTVLAQETAAAAQRVTQKGADQSGVVFFDGDDNRLPEEGSAVEPEPMCGYQLTAAQASELGPVLNLHGIKTATNADGAFVTMAQEDQPLIPLLLDERSEYRIAEATPVESCS